MFQKSLLTVAFGLTVLGHAEIFAEPGAKPANVRAVELARSALRLGITGDVAGRNETLKEALALDPDCELARWSLGQIKDAKGVWVAASTPSAETTQQLEFYENLREKVYNQDVSPLRLADWCRTNGMHDVEQFHLLQIAHNPSSDERERMRAIRRLDLVEYDGQLLPEETVTELKAEAAEQAKADRAWSKRVRRWRADLSSDSERRRDRAAKELKESAAVEAIPSYELMLLPASDVHAMATIDALGELDEVEATDSLLRIALLSESAAVRNAAIEKLKPRSMYDFVPQLLELFEATTEYQFALTTDAFGNITTYQQMTKAGRQDDHVATSTNRRSPVHGLTVNRSLILVQRNLFRPMSPAGETQNAYARYVKRPTRANRNELDERYRDQKLQELSQRLIAIEEMAKINQNQQTVGQRNLLIQARNQRVHEILMATTDASIVDPNPLEWWTWWKEHNELYSSPRETRRYDWHRSDPILYQVITMSCFPAGTHVLTERGARPIEEISPGDRVVSQDVDSAELGLYVVTGTTTRPASSTLQIVCGDNRVSSTLGHPFWVNNVGWRMAKELQVGQRIHALGGLATVTEIVQGETLEAHNLIVEGPANYFVGQGLFLLAHDNSLREPTRALTPGLQKQ